MNQQVSSPAQGLFDAIARSWKLPATALTLCFSVDGKTLAVLRQDGAISLAPMEDPEPPDARLRVAGDTGLPTIQARRHPPLPLISTTILSPEPMHLAPYGKDSFLAAGNAFWVIAADGSVTPKELPLPGNVTKLAHAQGTSSIAIISDHRLFLLSEGEELMECPVKLPADVTAICFSASGNHLALGCLNGTIILNLADAASQLITLPGTPESISWEESGLRLGCALGADGLAIIDVKHGTFVIFSDFPAPTLQLDWSVPGKALLASGAFRIAAWVAGEQPIKNSRDGALVTGQTGLIPVQAVAAHPTKSLAAAGYVNGQVTVASIGSTEELSVKPIGASVEALGWSEQGQLVVCDTEDNLAILTFPKLFFK